MEENNSGKPEQEILKGLLISEEDTRAKLQELVDKSRKLFRIDEKSKKILFTTGNKFTNREKILLFLIGKYFAKELKLIPDNEFKLKEIADNLAVKGTTLSKPLGEVCSEGLVEKHGDQYAIAHYRIEDVVDSISTRLESGKSSVPSRSSVNKVKKSGRKKKKEVPDEKRSITITSNPQGMEDLRRDLELEKDELNELFDFEAQRIHMLEALKGTTDSKTQLNTALCYLTAQSYYFQNQEIESADLTEIIEELGIGAISHLHGNLSKHRKLLIPKREKKRISSYRITTPGIQKGIILLKEYFLRKRT
jgi:hypothetical protein